MKTLMITKHQQSDERGFASIVIALTLVMILALLTVGFAQLTRREQRNALNKQLATQAYYAAETGINDAIEDIKSQSIIASNVGTGHDCQPVAAPSRTIKTQTGTPVSSKLDVSYSCVSIDLDPSSLAYTNFNDSNYHTVTFSSASAKKVKELTISWSSTAGKTASAASVPGAALKQKSAWNEPALMEISVTPLSSFDRASLINNNLTVYGYPVTGAAVTTNYDTGTSATEGAIIPARCTGSSCSLTISGFDTAAASAGVGPYMLHLTDHYDESTVTITGKDEDGNLLKFHGAQAVIDSTGRARGVLKRLQVHVPLNDSSILPNYAIEATNVCKRMKATPSSMDFVDPSGGAAADGTACGY